MTHSHTRRRGFTLIEMVTSLAILSVLLVACGSTLHLALKATGDSAVRAAAQAQCADAAAQIADDLNVATNFTQRTATAVTFTVPDRLNAGSPQTVKYSWTGVVGDPLYRQFNNGVATAVLPKLTNLNFTYGTRTLGATPATAVTVFDHQTTSGSTNNYAITSTKWAVQEFNPSLPSGASSYSITKVRLLLKGAAQDSVLLVSVRQATALGAPTTTVIAEAQLNTSALSTAYEWIDVPIRGATGLSPSQNVCVVLGYASGSTAVCQIQYDTALLAILSSANWTTSSNAGSSWAGLSLLSCGKVAVFGTVP